MSFKPNKKTRGWLTCKCAPLHTGHIAYMYQAATLVDELTIVLSYDAKLFKDPRLNLRNRLLALKQTFSDAENIKVVYIDETKLPAYPNGWQAWSELVIEKIGKDFDIIFSNEPGDVANYNKYFPGMEVVHTDTERSDFDISATRVRSDLYSAWGFLPTVVRRDFVKRFCIVGTESVGKTTLTKMLAKYCQTSWVEEYGRTFCEQNLFKDESLIEFDDYATIAVKRYEMELLALNSANRMIFADTAALSTNFFCLLDQGRTHPVVSAYEDLERYDHFIYLTDDVEWVDDGLRHESDRSVTRELFERMLFNYVKRQGATIDIVSGNYNDRLNKSIDLVKKYMAVPLKLV